MRAPPAPLVPEGYDPFTPTPDPFTPQATMAARCPVHRCRDGRAVMVMGMDAVLSVLRDPAAFSSRSLKPTSDDVGETLVHLDGEEHTRQRRLVNRAFTPRAVGAMQGRIEIIAHELIDGFCDKGATDLVGSYSGPLPFTVMAETLGVPPTDRARFVHWADEAIAAANVGERAPSDGELRSYILSQLEARRTAPSHDLISRIVHATDEGDHLTDPEAVALVRLLIIAGIETTTNLISTLLRYLLCERRLWEEVRRDRALVPAAVEEALRLDPPLNWTPRMAVEETEVTGQPIEAGSMVLVCLASANRDPSVHDRPHVFDLHRESTTGTPHVAFGNGVHFCLGAALARLEAKVALNALLDRLPDLEIAQGWEFEPRGPLMMRGCRSLDVVYEPRPKAAGPDGSRLRPAHATDEETRR
jgi:cytochrome P450